MQIRKQLQLNALPQKFTRQLLLNLNTLKYNCLKYTGNIMILNALVI